MKAHSQLLALALTILFGGGGVNFGEVSPVQLRCEYRSGPLGVDTAQPRLSWTLESRQRAQVQSAYRILVARSPEKLATDTGDLWDSGPVQSNESVHIRYAGLPLSSWQRVFWKVRAWDRAGQTSAWSAPASWTMGLMEPDHWIARWISAQNPAPPSPSKPVSGPVPLFRREFNAAQPVRRALLAICGLGAYELHLNGRKVGDHVLDPGWTNYRKQCLYATYDVTDQIQPGANALGVWLGNGMFNVAGGRYVKFTGSFGPPQLILQLQIEWADGTATQIGSDDSWRTAPGPITFSCIFGGEDYDARREPVGWDRPGFDDSPWSPAFVTAGPGGRLTAQSAPPVKVMRTFPTSKITEPQPGVFVHDLGQNFSGWPQLTVRGPAGSQVKLIPGELLDERGLVSQRSSGGPVSFSYTLKGDGLEVWHPRFTYYGFRYVQVEGASRDPAQASLGQPAVLDLEGQFVHSSAETVGQFSCSSDLFNRVHALIRAAILSNLQSVLTDCPHREKLGWLEVSHLLGPAIMFNYDVPMLYEKIVRDMRDAQLANGLVPDIAPEYTVFSGGFRDSPEWGSACVINPWHLYQRYGDRQVLEDAYPMMKRYVSHLATQSQDHIVSHGLGDWYDIGPGAPGESKLTTKGVTATAIYYHDLTILQEVASLLGQTPDAAQFAGLAQKVRASFNRKFFKAESNQYDRGSQTAQAMPLVFGLVEEDRQAAVLANLIADIRGHGNHLTAGDVGFRYLLMALGRAGRSDVIFDLASQTDAPSYGDQLKQGVTTLTEAWDGDRRSSQNHCMLGHAEEWFYSGLAGLQPETTRVGFGDITLRPEIVGDLAWAQCSYESVRGLIASRWEKKDGHLQLDVTIPANTAATVYVPATDPAVITESSRPAAEASGLQLVRREKNAVVYRVGSGTYRFRAPGIAVSPRSDGL